MQFSYPKNEKLKSQKTINKLFSEGKTVSNYPLRLVYVENTIEQNTEKTLMGVSVSKKYFKKAVDRNYFKRVLRECYRIHKTKLTENLEKNYAFMFFYQTKDKIPYQEIEQKTIQLFLKCNKTLK